MDASQPAMTEEDVANAATQLIEGSPEPQVQTHPVQMYSQGNEQMDNQETGNDQDAGPSSSSNLSNASMENNPNLSSESAHSGDAVYSSLLPSEHSSLGDIQLVTKSSPAFTSTVSSTPICTSRLPFTTVGNLQESSVEMGRNDSSKDIILEKDVEFQKLSPKKRRLLLSYDTDEQGTPVNRARGEKDEAESKIDVKLPLTGGMPSKRIWRAEGYDTDTDRLSLNSSDATPKKAKLDDSLELVDEVVRSEKNIPVHDLTRDDGEAVVKVQDSQDFVLQMPAQSQTFHAETQLSSQEVYSSWKSHCGTDIYDNTMKWDKGFVEKVADNSDSVPCNSYDSHKDNIYKTSFNSHCGIDKSCMPPLTNIMPPKYAKADTKLKLKNEMPDNVGLREECLARCIVRVIEGKPGQVKIVQLEQISLLDAVQENQNWHRLSLGSGSDTSGGLADKSSTTISSVSVPGAFEIPPAARSVIYRNAHRDSLTSTASTATSVSQQNKLKQAINPLKYDTTLHVSCPKCAHQFPFNPPKYRNSSSTAANSLEISPEGGSIETKPLTSQSDSSARNQPTSSLDSPDDGPPTVIKKPKRKASNRSDSSNASSKGLTETWQCGNKNAFDEEKTNIIFSDIIKTALKEGKSTGRKRGTSSRKKEKETSERKRTVKKRPTARRLNIVPAAAKTPEKIKYEAGNKKNPVFARWSDNYCYYPGYIEDETSEGGITLYYVHFCDGNRKRLSSTNVLPAENVRAGTCIMAKLYDGEEQEFESCLITEILESENSLLYKVEKNAVNEVLPFDRIALSAEVFKELHYLANKTPTYHKLSYENVLHTKRRRCCRTESTTPPVYRKTPKRNKTPAEQSPSTSLGLKGTKPAVTVPNLESDTDSSSVVTLIPDTFLSPFLSVEDSASVSEDDVKGKLGANQRNKSFSRPEDKNVGIEKGPIPEPGSRIFANCNFIFSHCSRVRERKKVKHYELSASETETDCPSTDYPMDITRLTKQVIAGGGRVYRTLSELPKDSSRSYLIANRPSRTPLYLQCIQRGIPCYSHDAIIFSCVENTPFGKSCKDELLPAGWSDETGHVEQAKSRTPLKKKTVLLALSEGEHSPDEILYWKKLLKKMSATVLIYRPADLRDYSSESDIDVIVTDPKCPPALLESGIPVANCNWIVHTLIHGEFRKTNATPAYHYTYVPEY